MNLRRLGIVSAVAVGLVGLVLGGHAVRNRVIASRALAAGMTAFEKGDWTSACAHLKVYLGKRPNDADALRRYAKAHLSSWPLRPDNLGAATGAYARLLACRPGDAEATEQLTRLYLLAGNPEAAASVCRSRLAVAPGDVVASLGLARALLAQHADDAAAEQLRAIADRNPDQIEAYAMLSEVAMRTSSASAVQAGLQWLDAAVERNPASAEARARRARFYRVVRKEGRAARTDLEVADAMKPTDLKSLLLLIEGWTGLGELARAEANLRALEALIDRARSDPRILTAQDVNLDNVALAVFTVKTGLALRRGAVYGPESANEPVTRPAVTGTAPASSRAAASDVTVREGFVRLADQALDELAGSSRSRFLPLAIELYIAGDRVDRARRCLEEYRQSVGEKGRLQRTLAERLVVLDATLACAEGRPYDVIRLLEGLLVRSSAEGLAFKGIATVEVWKLLAAAYSATGQERRATAALETYVNRQPGDWQATLELARAFLRSRDLAKALKYARDAEQLRPDDLSTRLVRLRASLRQAEESPRSSIATQPAELAALLAAHPRNGEVRVLQAIATFGQGRYDEAVDQLHAAMAECDDPLPAAIQLAEFHRARGQVDRAVEACRKATELSPGSGAPRVLLAELLVEAHRPDEARRTLETAVVELAGRDRRLVQEALVRRLVAADAGDKAVEVLRRMADAHPDDVAPRMGLLDLAEIQKQADVAQSLVDDLKRIEGETGVRWRFEQARLWLRAAGWQARQEEIAGLLRRCREADPGWAEPVALLGRMYEDLGKDDKAEEVYRGFVDQHPAEPAVVMPWLEMLERQRRFIAAGKLLDRLPGRLSALSGHRIKVAIGRGDYGAAIDELKKRVVADANNAIARVLLARLMYYHARDAAVATRLLDEAEAVNPRLPLILASRVSILHGENRDEEAMRLLDTEVARRNDSATFLLRAEFCASTGRLDQAEKDYRRLTTLADAAAEGYAELGRFYEHQGRAREALAAWEAGLERHPDDASLRLLLIRALMASPEAADRDRGLKLLNEAEARSPEDAGLMFLRATWLLEAGTTDATARALTLLDKVVQINPRDVRAHLLLIQRTREQGDVAKAAGFAARALGANPENPEILALQANLQREMNNPRLARELAQSVLEIDPANVTARVLMMYLDLQAGRVEAADAVNREAMAIDPADEDVQIGRALIDNARHRPDEAVRSLEAYCRSEAGRTSVRARVTLADLFRIGGDFGRSREHLDAAARLAPGDAAVFLGHLRWLADQGRYDEVLVALADRRKGAPDDVRILLPVASMLAYARADHYVRESRALFSRCVELDPGNVDGHLGLAQVAYQLGDVDTAVDAYAKVLELDAFHPQALNNRAWLLSERLNRPAEAIDLATKGILRYPNDPHLLDTRGVACLRAGRLAEARRDLESALSLIREDPPARARTLANLARVYVKQRELSRARASLDEAMSIDNERNVFTEAERTEYRRLSNLMDTPRSGGT